MSQSINKLEEALTFLDDLQNKKVTLKNDKMSYLTKIEVESWYSESLLKRTPVEIGVEFTRYRILDDRYDPPTTSRTDNKTLLLSGSPTMIAEVLNKIANIEEYK